MAASCGRRRKVADPTHGVAGVWWRSHLLRLDIDPPHFQPYVRFSLLTADFRAAEGLTDPRERAERLAVLDGEADRFLAGLEATDFVSVITRGDGDSQGRPYMGLVMQRADAAMSPGAGEDARSEGRRIFCTVVHAVGLALSTVPIAGAEDLLSPSWARMAATAPELETLLPAFIDGVRDALDLLRSDTLRFINRGEGPAADMEVALKSPMTGTDRCITPVEIMRRTSDPSRIMFPGGGPSRAPVLRDHLYIRERVVTAARVVASEHQRVGAVMGAASTTDIRMSHVEAVGSVRAKDMWKLGQRLRAKVSPPPELLKDTNQREPGQTHGNFRLLFHPPRPIADLTPLDGDALVEALRAWISPDKARAVSQVELMRDGQSVYEQIVAGGDPAGAWAASMPGIMRDLVAKHHEAVRVEGREIDEKAREHAAKVEADRQELANMKRDFAYWAKINGTPADDSP